MKYLLRTKYILIVAVSIVLFYACANHGQGPAGGPKDTTPPSVMKSIPSNNALNTKKGKVEIIFNENINVLKAAENVIISPPQRIAPEIKSYGKTVVVQLNDTLMPNTTYSINFGDAIVDNTENNPIKNYYFSFATGNEIDTLQIAGTLMDAQNLNPVPGVTIGIYSDLSDTVFMKKPFQRITRTDDKGYFMIPNVHEGRYKVYALADVNRDNFYQPGEALAFNDSVFKTSFEHYMRSDTLWIDSVTVDTVRIVPAVRYFPDNVALRYFKDETTRQYLVKSERSVANKISLYFNTKSDKLPKIKPLNITDWDNNVLIQKNQRLDSLTYWFKDSTLIKKDTINLEVRYFKSDSAFQLKPQTDTISFIMRKPKGNVPPKPSSKSKSDFLTMTTNISPQFDVYNPIKLTFDVPIKSFDTTKVHFFQVKDTIEIPLKFHLQKLDSIGFNYAIYHKWIPETSYRLKIDSAAIFSLYNKYNDKFKNELKVKSLDEYAALKLKLAKYNPKAVFQVLNKNDEVVKSAPAQPNGTSIQYLSPGDYFLRVFIDSNQDGLWTSGSYLKKQQPEEVYYYPKKLSLIKNWEFEETWDYLSTPLSQQKPKELIKSPTTQKN